MYGGRRNIRYIIGLAVTIILLFLVIFLIIHHGSNKGKVPVTHKTLTSLTNEPGTSVRETVDGQVNSASQHNELQITVSASTVEFELFKGYQGQVDVDQQYPNNTTAYNVFLSALDHAGYTKGSTSGISDDRGYCPTGDRYVFEVMENGKDVERFWTNSCGTPKTFNGDTDLVLGLFQAQVPNYDAVISN